MISDKKMMEIAERLLVKAKAAQVRWRSIIILDDEGYVNKNYKNFSVQFKESKFYIYCLFPSTELDCIVIGIENKDGWTIRKVSVEEDGDDPRWRLFLDLYSEAERSVLGSDRVLGEIEEELQKEGAIGQA